MKKLAIGVDIGGTRTKIGLVDLNAGTVIKSIISLTEKKSAKAFESAIDSAFFQLQELAGDEADRLNGIGFGVPSFVMENGIVDSTYGFLEFMEDYPLAEIIEQKFGLPCRADNDARIVALGEALYGEGRDAKRMLMLTLGTGLGLGFTVNGKLPEPLPYAHMGGHMTITQNEVKCYCGKTGCLESLVSATGIVDAARRAGWKKKQDLPITAEAIFQTAAEGDSVARSVIQEWLMYLKTGIDNYINIYAPDSIILGGGVANALKDYIPFLEEGHLLRPFKNYHAKISISTLQENAGILGSAALFVR